MAGLIPANPSADDVSAGTTRALREKLHEALTALDDMSSDQHTPARQQPSPPSESEVLAILKARRRRSQFFPEDLFADPAWDILLELYATELGQRRISISSLCIGAGVPATTALRWINALENKGLITRQDDPVDGRRVYASLAEKGIDAMQAYFAGAARPSLGVI